jgi:hypothetical protein
MLARPGEPRFHGAFVQAKGDDNGLEGTAVGQQGHDASHLARLGVRTITDGALRLGKGLATDMADVAMFFGAMDTDVPLPSLSRKRTARIGAECGLWIHRQVLRSKE